MLDVQTVLRPWSSHAWRVALASTAVALPLYVLPAGAGAASPGQPLQQPPQAQIARALDRAAPTALPPGYPRLYGVPSAPAVLLKAVAWEESTWRQFQATDVPLASPAGGYGVMQLTDGTRFNAAGQPIGPRAWASAGVATTPVSPVVATATPISAGVATAAPVPTAVVSPTVSGGPAVVQVARHISLGSADNAAYVADATIPDGTILAPGQRFTKTWQIQNTGTSTWDSRYHWQFEAGAPLGTVRAVTAPIVPPGATALFS
ncbi:MAG TPA: NBR1-Ig-like domain-containing protein, partial [Chloroflexota bacterium]|nr:NBR1-Ig-like domain-containing protein [Chloroflexota bacterium]